MEMQEIKKIILRQKNVMDLREMIVMMEASIGLQALESLIVGESVKYHTSPHKALAGYNGKVFKVIEVTSQGITVENEDNQQFIVPEERLERMPKKISDINITIDGMSDLEAMKKMANVLEDSEEYTQIKEIIALRIKAIKSKTPYQGDSVLLEFPINSAFHAYNNKQAKVVRTDGIDYTVLCDGMEFNIGKERIMQILERR